MTTAGYLHLCHARILRSLATPFVMAWAALSMPASGWCQSTTSSPGPSPSFIAFESGHVRPLAISTDGKRLFAVNTPNNSLDVFQITDQGLKLATRVPVGLEPVAVAVRGPDEVWVVNHLSDSVSVVSLAGTPRVVRTLLVGDEPRDIVFAGSPSKAFVTTAHRGQHRLDPSLQGVPGAGDPQFTTPGVGRADVWVFDAARPGDTMGGRPMRIMSFFADTPRALAVSPDQNTVYVAAFHSGNQTSIVNEDLVCNGFVLNRPCMMKGKIYPGGALGPKANAEGKPAPETGVMVKYSATTGKWLDGVGRDWSSAMRFNLPDKDVFAIDANSLTDKAIYTSVGTTLFNMVTNPRSGTLYVSNTEALNMGRFEGDGAHGGTSLQGKLAQTRITVIHNSAVSPRHLNKHIDYARLANSPDFDTQSKQHSLSTPLDMAVSKDGARLYVTAFGSSKIGVFSTEALESDAFDPRRASSNYITVSGGGPSGLVLDEARGQLYVLTRFDNAIKVINLATHKEADQASMLNPEPASIVKGRPFLYDAQLTSANGEAACASCHIFGDMDDLAWDLGNPDEKVTASPLEGNFTDPLLFLGAKIVFGIKAKINGSDKVNEFHPMKGPMTTQTLRGIRNSGAMHWRGDRSNGAFGTSATDAMLSFKNFAPAFKDLLGNKVPLSEADMQQFADFQLSVVPPPNPVRPLNNQLTPAQQRGKDFFFGDRPSDGVGFAFLANLTPPGVKTAFNCAGCHITDAEKGMFGADGKNAFDGASQMIKIPHLRNQYAKIGMFGSPTMEAFTGPDTGHLGDQIRGFGFTHDGAVDTIFRFLTARVLRTMGSTGFPSGEAGNQVRRDSAAYVIAFDSDLPPIVGQQITLTARNATEVGARIDLLIERAKAPFVSKALGGKVTECDLVARLVVNGQMRGYLFNATSNSFLDESGQALSDAALRAMASQPGQEITYTCAPAGTGRRMAYSS